MQVPFHIFINDQKVKLIWRKMGDIINPKKEAAVPDTTGKLGLFKYNMFHNKTQG